MSSASSASGEPCGRDDRGAVTAELALALPVLLALTAGLVWLSAVAVAQVRTVDAAREVARAVARGDDPGAAVALGEQVAPEGVRLSVSHSGQRVVVRARGRLSGPGGLLGALPGATLDARAVALAEAGAGAS
ncbi:TadE family type IV pilus minor pilin [Nocardioides sp. R1-1]|uniref:TadE family type IV pilus minor pilin n=1 Tax=Nocardioides sp. R1-1 TaxID=3383502 RepID=UPI0038D04F95